MGFYSYCVHHAQTHESKVVFLANCLAVQVANWYVKPNQSNHSSQSQRTQTINQLKLDVITDAIRGKTCANAS